MAATVLFRTADAIVVLVYVAATIGIGVYFTRRNDTTEEYFLGGRAFAGWVVGISMFATSISSITFLALPAAAYVLDWRQFVPNLVLPVVVIVVVLVFIPLFRTTGRTSAFEYLEERFGPAVRTYGAVSYIVLQVVRTGTILYLISLPLSVLTGLPVPWLIVITGVCVAFYTAAGGIEAVIWTDVVQAGVLIVGGPLCLFFLVRDVPGGFGEILSAGASAGKFSLGEVAWDLSDRTLPGLVLLGLFQWLGEHAYGQHVVQRYLAARSTREARKATLLFVATSLPIWAFFFLLGTSLWVYYQVLPDPAIVGLEADRILPHFILTRVPAGLAGLVIAAVLAAAMSSLDSSLNSVATVATVDLFKRHLLIGRGDGTYLRLARFLSCVAAAFMIFGALVFNRMEKESMVDVGIVAISIFAGCLLGVFLAGFFSTRIDYRATLWGMTVALAFDVYLVLCYFECLPAAVSVEVHTYWIGILVNVVFLAVAYVAGLARGGIRQVEIGLTVWGGGLRRDAVTTEYAC